MTTYREEPLVRVGVSMNDIRAFSERWGIAEFALFGSVLRDDFRPDSDVDVLVTFLPDRVAGFAEFFQMQDELEQLFGRKVDVGEKRWVEASENYIRRKHILSTLERVYAAG